MATRDPIENEPPDEGHDRAAARLGADTPPRRDDTPRWLVPTDPPPV